MSLPLAVQSLSNNSSLMSIEALDGVKPQALRYLSQAGSFPSTPEFVSLVRTECQRSSANLRDIAIVLSREPVTALRLIARVNGSFYGAAREVSSMNEALHQFGLQQLPDIVAGVGPAGTHSNFFRGRGLAQLVYAEMLLTSRIIEGVFPAFPKAGKSLSSILILAAAAQVGGLGLALARPNVASAFTLDQLGDERSDGEAVWKKILGAGPLQFSMELLKELKLPPKLIECVPGCGRQGPLRSRFAAGEPVGSDDPSTIVFYCARLAREVLYQIRISDLNELLKDISRRSGVSEKVWREAIQKAVAGDGGFGGLVSLPNAEVIQRWSQSDRAEVKRPSAQELQSRMGPSILELKTIFRTPLQDGTYQYLPQAVLATLSALLFGAKFQRVLFLRFEPNRELLLPVVSLGKGAPGMRTLIRRFGNPDAAVMPDLRACTDRAAVFEGDPIFEDGWPFVAFPVIWRNQVLGVFYADYPEHENGLPIDTPERLAITSLAEQWQNVPDDFCEPRGG
jgi:HD-like signal output (HDOD) protein